MAMRSLATGASRSLLFLAMNNPWFHQREGNECLIQGIHILAGGEKTNV